MLPTLAPPLRALLPVTVRFPVTEAFPPVAEFPVTVSAPLMVPPVRFTLALSSRMTSLTTWFQSPDRSWSPGALGNGVAGVMGTAVSFLPACFRVQG